MFEGNRYRNGFLYKNFVMSAIVSWYYCVKYSFIVQSLYTFVHLCICMCTYIMWDVTIMCCTCSSQLYEGVKPTLGELEKFEATPDEAELNGKSYEHITCKLVYTYAITVTSGSDGKAGSTLVPGDIVEVCEGQLMHLQGNVINVEGDVITIMPKHEDLKVHTCLHTCRV